MKKHIPDALLYVGAGLVSYGAYCIYPPSGFIAGGALVMALGWLSAKA
jgi:hypothetical protein